MGAIHVSDELQGVIEGQVARGRAASPSAFLEEAVKRFVDEGLAEEGEVRRAAGAGIADAEAGRVTTVATSEDERLLHQRLMSGLQVLEVDDRPGESGPLAGLRSETSAVRTATSLGG